MIESLIGTVPEFLVIYGAVLILLLLIRNPVIIAHEQSHAFALEILGYNSTIEYYRGSLLSDDRLITSGSTYVRPMMREGEMSRLETIFVSMAPLAIVIALMPIYGTAMHLLPVSLTEATVFAWMLIYLFGPSESDWIIVFETVLDENELEIPELANHQTAEGIS